MVLLDTEPGFSPRKFNFLTTQVAPKQPSIRFIFIKEYELKQFPLNISESITTAIIFVFDLIEKETNLLHFFVQMFSDLLLCSHFVKKLLKIV